MPFEMSLEDMKNERVQREVRSMSWNGLPFFIRDIKSPWKCFFIIFINFFLRQTSFDYTWKKYLTEKKIIHITLGLNILKSILLSDEEISNDLVILFLGSEIDKSYWWLFYV